MNHAMVHNFCVAIKGVDGQIEYLVPEAVFKNMLNAAVKNIYLDEAWYLKKYPDVVEAAGRGTLVSAAGHYVRYGFFESRQPHKINGAEKLYINQYPDVAVAIQRGSVTSVQEHFDVADFKEGRMPYQDLNLFGDQ